MSNNTDNVPDNDLHDSIVDAILELKKLLFIHNTLNNEKYSPIISQLIKLHIDFTVIAESQNK